MSAEIRTVDCDVHGPQQETFVCNHIVTSVRTGDVVGFFWSNDSGSPRPDAWCAACNDVVRLEGEWNERSEKFADIKLLCGKCYDRARELNFPGWRKYFSGSA